MNRLTRSVTLAALALACLTGPAAAKDATTRKKTLAPGVVDLAICLDTSGSMNGLLNAARQKLWAIINDLALAKPTPKLRVALVTFGNDGHNAENGWVLRQTDLTEDLDLVSDKLFGLTTNGGTELVGRVLQTSVDQLSWSKDPGALKLIILAGNESAEQDTVVDFRDVCKKAIGRGIMVNSIYCGNPADPIAAAWSQVSKLADGHFATIDKDQGTVVIATPFDEQLAGLSASINETYIPFGTRGQWSGENQRRQDANASGLNSAAAASRAGSKASGCYVNSRWDLVDACRDAKFKLAELKVEDLPEEMRKMTAEERAKHVVAMRKKRDVISAKIKAADAKRRKYIEDEMRKGAETENNAFDFAVRKAIREQARIKGFRFEG